MQRFGIITILVLVIMALAVAGCAKQDDANDSSSGSSNFLPRLGM